MEELRETSDDNTIRSAEENCGADNGFRTEDMAEYPIQSDNLTERVIGGKVKIKAAIKRFFISFKVKAAYFAYMIVFLTTFAVMLLFLTLAAVGIPMGIIFGVFGIAIKLFKADFIITQLAPELMIFGGLAAACGTAFCGLLAVKAGFMVSRLFLKIKRRCDRLRGWVG